MRNDLQQSLNRSYIDPSTLSIFQRILLTTDGTVTDMLEAYLFEQIRLVKLSEELVTTTDDIDPMQLNKGSSVLDRKILLQGKISRKNYIYAESIIVIDRLDEYFQKDLLKTKTPIGKIWREQRFETFKEIVDTGKKPAKELADYFDIEPEANLLFRTYCVFSNRQSVMMISEYFPESYFLNRV
ncbi:chorismate pyruvate-lyase family protein [Moorena sp. SIO4A5]|uniref:chorismate--pyruvate lyase family protein n=1 Tax=Moorena sp. SIO4A5 TaxID=2607838 RepID=UPI0013CD156A|nr:chorismate pyruvate-lyase family protein [Moorena sp. SIO4A5]NEO19166.1 DUF98 domain-containing protein [Moorena sp. SIO4A5]